MIYAGCLLILVGLLFLRLPFINVSRNRGVTSYAITPAGFAGLACVWTGIVFAVAMLKG